jgi:hypothetical protein
MSVTDREREWGRRASRFLKAELKRSGIGYKELALRLAEHGLEETETSIAGKLSRGAFAVSFFLATMKAIGRDNLNLAEI